MIYYNNKSASAKLQTGGQTPKEFQTEYIQSSKYAARLKSSGYQAIPKVVEKRLGQVEQTGLNKYRKTLGEALMSFQVPAGTGSHFDNSRVNIDYKTDLHDLKKGYPGMTMPSPIEVEAHEFSHPSVADLKGLSQDNIMNDYDNRQLIGRGQRLPYVNDHDKRASENKADIDAYRYMLKQKGVYDAGKETFTKEHLKNNSKNFSRERLQRNYSDKNLIWLMNNVASSPSVPSASPPVAGSSPLVPYNNSQRVMKAQAGMQMDWDAVRNVNDNGLVQTAKIFDPTGISSYPDVYYAYKDMVAGKGSATNLGLNILGALPVIGKAKTIFRMAKLNRVGKPTVGLIKAMDGVASITSSINKVTGAPVAYARTLSGSSNRVVRGASYLAKGADNISTNLAKKLRPTGEKYSYKVITNSDYKNLGVDVLDTGNFLHDLNAAVSTAVPTKKSLIDKNKKIVFTDSNNAEKAYTNINQ